MIDPAWEGKVLFYELFFGTPLSYWFLVIMWEKLLREPLEEWRYAMLTYLAASFYIVNHYFQFAPFYGPMLWSYAGLYVVIYFWLAVKPAARTVVWKVLASLSAVVFTIAFILFENIARFGVAQGCSEFWFMFSGNVAFIALIIWRMRALRPA